MIVNDPNVIVCNSGLASVEISDDKSITLTLKNDSTLTFNPKVVDNKVVDYKMIYFTGKENRQIAKLKEKIDSLQLQIEKITYGNSNNDIEDNIE